MTVHIVAVVLALLTGYLLLEDWWWQRQHKQRADRRSVPAVRCLVCPGQPMVEDFRTHSRLVHQARVTAPEDDQSWGRRSA